MMLKKLLDRKYLLLGVALVCFASNSIAQELNCTVKVMSDGIQGQGQDKEVFRNMESAISTFLNTRKWTDDQFGPQEKINCNLLMNVTQTLPGVQNGFSATITVQSTRPVYNSSYQSQMVKHVDKQLQFAFNQFQPLEFNDNRVVGNNAFVSNLSAVLAFYAYIMIGMDYESFSPKGGQTYFKRAQNIVNNAPEQGKTISGWKAVEGNYNRYWLSDQLLNPRFQALRTVWYSMHRQALDSMYKKPAESQKVILNSINTLSQLQKENPGSFLIQFFFNAKSDEFASIVAQQPEANRALYISLLSQMDVPNTQKYNSLKKL